MDRPDAINWPVDISIPLRFNGPQPNAYGVEPAAAAACEYGALIGDTRRGGSVNFERYTLIPHCNGTHTECIGHVTHERISVRDCLRAVMLAARLVSVEPVRLDNGDRVITADSIIHALQHSDSDLPKAAIVRTLPNDIVKLTREYGTDAPGSEKVPPFFAADAVRSMVENGVSHLLTDLPSIDRIYDEGKLENHRLFWGIEPGSFEARENSRRRNTITEMIFVPDVVPDGEYLLNLQIAPFESDCAPSRPMLLKK